MNKLKAEIEARSVDVFINIGADGKLFGSVTTKQIVESFEEQTGIRIDRKKIRINIRNKFSRHLYGNCIITQGC